MPAAPSTVAEAVLRIGGALRVMVAGAEARPVGAERRDDPRAGPATVELLREIGPAPNGDLGPPSGSAPVPADTSLSGLSGFAVAGGSDRNARPADSRAIDRAPRRRDHRSARPAHLGRSKSP